MIIATSAFLLSAGQPLSRARIGYQTYTQNAIASDLTVSGDSADFPKDSVLRPDTATFWKPPSLPGTLVHEFNGTKTLDYVAIAAHNLFTCGATLLVEYQIGASAWTTFAAAATPANNGPIMFIGSPVSADRIRLMVSGGGAIPSIGVLYDGVMLAMEKGVSPPYTPINMARDDVLENTMSRTGQFLGQDFRSKGVKGSAMFRNLSSSWVRTYFDPFVLSARARPHFFAWNPLQFPLELGFVWVEKNILAKYMGQLDQMEAQWEMVGVGYE